ncbi:MAG: hypothetical protein NZ580_04210 [Bacteroidia bacterium]|nr:hypothetical protein [Bacteroidia bacterium]MDW8236067.1 hypothetical protein [Bacteroidia bacterium]
MSPFGAYLGLFTGLVIMGMGIYLYVKPLPAHLPWWVVQGLPFFLVAYGAVRWGYSFYLVWRKKRPSSSALSAILLLILNACSSGPEPNLRIRFDYVGDCSHCPIQRMDSLLRFHFPLGVVATTFDSVQHQVVLDLDSQHVRLDTLSKVLLAYGYEINGEISIDPILSPCCTYVGEEANTHGTEMNTPTPISSGSGDASKRPSASSSMSEYETETDPHLPEMGILLPEEQLEASIEAELNTDEALGIEDIDLGDGMDLGGAELEELDFGDDLDLDNEGTSPPKKGTAKK